MIKGLLLMALGMLLATAPAAAAGDPQPGSLVLWYRQPAATWVEALPVGNGRLGAMVFGGPDKERLQLNEVSLPPRLRAGRAPTPIGPRRTRPCPRSANSSPKASMPRPPR